jgi:hypothetical protein
VGPRQVEARQPGLQRVHRGGAADRRGQRPDQGDRDLDGGEEALGIPLELRRDRRARDALIPELGETARARRDQRELRAGEEAVRDDRHPDQDQLDPDTVHVSLVKE